MSSSAGPADDFIEAVERAAGTLSVGQRVNRAEPGGRRAATIYELGALVEIALEEIESGVAAECKVLLRLDVLRHETRPAAPQPIELANGALALEPNVRCR